MTLLTGMIFVYSDIKKIANTNEKFSGYIWADIKWAVPQRLMVGFPS
jgi:hypothetical protein